VGPFASSPERPCSTGRIAGPCFPSSTGTGGTRSILRNTCGVNSNRTRTTVTSSTARRISSATVVEAVNRAWPQVCLVALADHVRRACGEPDHAREGGCSSVRVQG
jgi:hypothetical protein